MNIERTTMKKFETLDFDFDFDIRKAYIILCKEDLDRIAQLNDKAYYEIKAKWESRLKGEVFILNFQEIMEYEANELADQEDDIYIHKECDRDY